MPHRLFLKGLSRALSEIVMASTRLPAELDAMTPASSTPSDVLQKAQMYASPAAPFFRRQTQAFAKVSKQRRDEVDVQGGLRSTCPPTKRRTSQPLKPTNAEQSYSAFSNGLALDSSPSTVLLLVGDALSSQTAPVCR